MSYFDTHAHLNFKRFKSNLSEIVEASQKAEVTHIVIPGTDSTSSQRAVEIASHYSGTYAAVGIHPHHAYEFVEKEKAVTITEQLEYLKTLIKNNRSVIVAIGEVGLDAYQYEHTKYEAYHTNKAFLNVQKDLFIKQLELARESNLAVIIHNREAATELLNVLQNHWDSYFVNRVAFHCCEPREDLLSFAQEHKIFIGVDGDVTYDAKKQAFIRQVPLDQIVVETDSPYLLPEPLRSSKQYPNIPANIPVIVDYISSLRSEPREEVKLKVFENSLRLFSGTKLS